MAFSTIFGAWIAAFLTLGILSYLYRDNPFYKIAEHVFVGVSAAYWAATFYWTQIYPNLFGRLFPKDGPFSFIAEVDFNHEFNILYFFPLLLGIMMLLSIFKQFFNISLKIVRVVCIGFFIIKEVYCSCISF